LNELLGASLIASRHGYCLVFDFCKVMEHPFCGKEPDLGVSVLKPGAPMDGLVPQRY
jgi:hypothetical protein